MFTKMLKLLIIAFTTVGLFTACNGRKGAQGQAGAQGATGAQGEIGGIGPQGPAGPGGAAAESPDSESLGGSTGGGGLSHDRSTKLLQRMLPEIIELVRASSRGIYENLGEWDKVKIIEVLEGVNLTPIKYNEFKKKYEPDYKLNGGLRGPDCKSKSKSVDCYYTVVRNGEFLVFDYGLKKNGKPYLIVLKKWFDDYVREDLDFMTPEDYHKVRFALMKRLFHELAHHIYKHPIEKKAGNVDVEKIEEQARDFSLQMLSSLTLDKIACRGTNPIDPNKGKGWQGVFEKAWQVSQGGQYIYSETNESSQLLDQLVEASRMQKSVFDDTIELPTSFPSFESGFHYGPIKEGWATFKTDGKSWRQLDDLRVEIEKLLINSSVPSEARTPRVNVENLVVKEGHLSMKIGPYVFWHQGDILRFMEDQCLKSDEHKNRVEDCLDAFKATVNLGFKTGLKHEYTWLYTKNTRNEMPAINSKAFYTYEDEVNYYLTDYLADMTVESPDMEKQDRDNSVLKVKKVVLDKKKFHQAIIDDYHQRRKSWPPSGDWEIPTMCPVGQNSPLPSDEEILSATLAYIAKGRTVRGAFGGSADEFGCPNRDRLFTYATFHRAYKKSYVEAQDQTFKITCKPLYRSIELIP